MYRKVIIILSILWFSFFFLARYRVNAQSNVQCGDIFQGEFTASNSHIYYGIYLKAGTVIHLDVIPIGDYLKFTNVNYIFAPSGSFVGYPQYSNGNAETIETNVLGETGTYSIELSNYQDTGAFRLYVNCTLPDGTVVKAGDKVVPTVTPTIVPNQTPVATATISAFSGVGFPGLEPVDFSSAVTVDMHESGEKGTIPISGDSVLSYALTANAGNVLTINFTRISGNLNLGLVVLTPDKKVLYQASLVNTDTMSAQFKLPVSGQDTISIFRIDLLPPDKPEQTSFSLQASITS